MRLWISLCLFLGFAPLAHADNGAPAAVIDAQIEAFRANDLGTAFSFASPHIQRMFGTPERFGRMVKRSYPMVWRPAQVRYGQFRESGIQIVYFTDDRGGVFEAHYDMIPTDDSWQINGVYVRTAGVGA